MSQTLIQILGPKNLKIVWHKRVFDNYKTYELNTFDCITSTSIGEKSTIFKVNQL